MTERITFEIEFTRDPTVKLTKRQLERIALEHAAHRYLADMRFGQQSTLNVEAITITRSDATTERREF